MNGRQPNLSEAALRPSLHDNFARHLGVDRAEIIVSAGLVERERKLIVGVERLGLEKIICARDSVRDVVAIRPRNFRSGRDGDFRRPKTEIVYLHRSRGRLRLRRGRGDFPVT